MFPKATLAAFSLLYATAALTIETVPIAMDVRFDVNAITHNWSAATFDRVVQQTREEITKALRERFEYWDFRPQPDYPTALVLWVADPNPEDPIIEAELRLEVRTQNQMDQEWRTDWLLPTDIQYRRYPTAEQMPTALRDKLERYFIDEPRVDLVGWLRNKVPLGKKGVWLGNDYRIVLSMPDQHFRAPRWSIFRIDGRPGSNHAGMRETLKAYGINFTAPWPLDAQPPHFNGLVVQAMGRCVGGELRMVDNCIGGQRRDIGPEAHRLQLGPVYLLMEQGESLSDMDVFFEEDSP